MARPKSKGLDYFSHDTDMSNDERLEFIEAEYGLMGYAVYNKILEIAYRNEGYFITFNERYSKLLAKRFGIETETLVSVINSCINEGLFHDNLHLRYGILTSWRMQANYVKGCERRTECSLIEEYILIDPKKIIGDKIHPEIIITKLEKNVKSTLNGVNVTETEVNVTETAVSSEVSTQRRGEESKEEDSKENKRKKITKNGSALPFSDLDWKFEKEQFLAHSEWSETYLMNNAILSEEQFNQQRLDFLTHIEDGGELKKCYRLQIHFRNWNKPHVQKIKNSIKPKYISN